MIKYLTITTAFFTMTLLDGQLNIYMAEKAIDYNILGSILNYFQLTGTYIEYSSLGNFKPPKLLFTQYTSNLTPVFVSFDIISNIGSRAYIYINPFYLYIYTHLNLPLILGFFIILANGIYSNFFYSVKYLSNKGLYMVRFRVKLYVKSINKFNPLISDKKKPNAKIEYLVFKLLKNINFNYIPKHLTNLKIFIGRPHLTKEQENNPVVTQTINNRNRHANYARTRSEGVVRNANSIITLMVQNNITVFMNHTGILSIQPPHNLTPIQVQTLTDNINNLYLEIGVQLARMRTEHDRLLAAENILRSLGVSDRNIDISAAIARAQHALNDLTSRITPV